MNRILFALASLYLCVSAGSLTAAENPSVVPAAARDLLARKPGLRVHMSGDKLQSLYGRAITTGTSAVDSAEKFRQDEWQVFGVPPAELKPQSVLFDGRHTQPVKYNRATGEYEMTLVYYSHFINDVPVFRSDMRVLVRNEADFPAVMVKSSLRPVDNFQVPAGGVSLDANAAINAALALYPKLNDFTAVTPVIWNGFADVAAAAPILAAKFEGYNHALAQGRLFVVDAQTNQILYEENKICDVDVVGSVRGTATEGTAAEQCANESIFGLPYTQVNLLGPNATSVFTDVDGNFLLPNPGTDDVTVESVLGGQYFDVFDFAGAVSFISQLVDPSNPVSFTHNPFNTEFFRAQVNAYLQANVVRDYILDYNPLYPDVSTHLNFPIWVNRTDGFCPQNAWYSPGEQSINFCQSSGSIPNTAWSSVVWHEYGHHIVEMSGSGQCQYGEGMSDCIAVIVSDESELGLGFFGGATCDQPLRDADNNCQYSQASCTTNCGGPCHSCGRLISGSVWSTRNNLLASHPATYRDIISTLVVNAILLRSPGDQSIDESIAVDYLMVDDDDANLDNGTPHRNQICNGFADHGLNCPPLALVTFSYPNGQPALINPDQSTTLAVNVLPINGTPIPNSGTISYSVDGAPFTTVPMTEVATNSYEATLPAVGCTSTVQYYVDVQTQESGSVTDPPDAPDTAYSTFAALSLDVVEYFDFETAPGWTVSGNATDGQWTLGIPVDCNRGDPPTDADGSGSCWLTDNAPQVDCNTDVDGGATTLTSSLLDLSGLDEPIIQYARWYNNVEGDSPAADIFEVEISNNNGANWLDLETVGPSGAEVVGGWIQTSFRVSDFLTPTSTMRVRFTASDPGAGSIVEAAVDGFSIVDPECAPAIPTITAQPSSVTACENDEVAFSVSAQGSPPLQYQWRLGGVDIPGATSNPLIIAAAELSDVGSYDCIVSNDVGSVQSDPATLALTELASCDDSNSCSVDSCAVGACINTVVAPVADVEGSRSVAATPDACGDVVALRVTSPDYPCLDAYADADGFLTLAPVFQTPAAWQTVHIRGADIVPESTYHVATELQGGAVSDVSSVSTVRWGDANLNGVVNLEDVQFIIFVFQGNEDNATLEAADIEPCQVNGVANIADAQTAVSVFQGAQYGDFCAIPCK